MGHSYLFGLGSPFGGDQLGWRSADLLQHHFADRADITVARLSQPTDLFLYPVTPADLTIFMDAMLSEQASGHVRQFTASHMPNRPKAISSHGISLRTTVDLLLGMGFASEQIQIFAFDIADTSTAADLDAAARIMAARIRETLAQPTDAKSRHGG